MITRKMQITDKHNSSRIIIHFFLNKVKKKALTRRIRKLELRRSLMIKMSICYWMMIPRLLVTSNQIKMMKYKPALSTRFYKMKAKILYRTLRMLSHLTRNSRVHLTLKLTLSTNSSLLKTKTKTMIIKIPRYRVNLAQVSTCMKIQFQLKLLLILFFR